MDQEAIATTIVGMSDREVLRRNLGALDFKMPDGLLEEIAKVVAPIKNTMWYEGLPENDLRKKI